MASSRGGYDSGAGGKIRRRAPSRAAAASPYARPPSAPVARGGEGRGWLARLVDPASRLLTSGASRLFSSVFGKPPAPTPALLDAPPPQPEVLGAPLSHPEIPDTPHSPPELLDGPPPLEDDLPEGEENCELTNVNPSTKGPGTAVKDGDDATKWADDCSVTELEELLKQKTFTRTEFEYLAELLRSRTVHSDSLKREIINNVKEAHVSEREKGTRDSNAPADFSIRTSNVAGQVASPAELAKAYMGSKSSNGSPLRLRLHNPASLPVKSTEPLTVQSAKPPALSLLPSSSMCASTFADRLESNYATPNRSAIYRMSSSPYFKSAVSSRDSSGTVSSAYQTPSSVHTFGRQVLKRKSTVLNNESISVGPIRRMRQRYNTISPLLDTRPGYCGYLASSRNRSDEDVQHSTQIQKRQCLEKADEGSPAVQSKGYADSKVYNNNLGRAPPQSTEMAAKILKQLDTLVPSQKEDASEIRHKHVNVRDIENHTSQKKKGLMQGNLLEPSAVGIKEASFISNVNGAAKFTPTVTDGKSIDAISDKSAMLKSKNFGITSPEDSLESADQNKSSKMLSHQANDKIEKSEPVISEHTARNSGTTNKEKPPKFTSRSHTPSSLILSNQFDPNKMLASSNGFSFPVPAALSAHLQAPPTPTMGSPPILPVEERQSCPPVASVAPCAAAEVVPRTLKSLSEDGSIDSKCGQKSNMDGSLNLSKSSSGEVALSANPSVFSFANTKSTALINGLAYTSGSSASVVVPANGLASSIFSTNADSTTPLSHYSFQSGSQIAQTAAASLQKSDTMSIGAVSSVAQSSATGGTLSFSSTAIGSSSAASKMFSGTASKSVLAPSLAFSSAGNSSAPLSSSVQFSSASSLVQGKSKAASTESAFGTRTAESGNGTIQLTQSSASNFSSFSSPAANFGSPSFANPSFNSAPSGSSPLNSSSVFSFAAGSGSSPLNSSSGSLSTAGFGSSSLNSSSLFSFAAGSGSTTTVNGSSSLPAMSSGLGSNSGFSPSPVFGTNLATTAPPSSVLPTTGSASSPSVFASTPSPISSFTLAAPTVPNPLPATPLFGIQNSSSGFSTGTDQMKVGNNMNSDKNQSPFYTAPSFGLPSSSPVTPNFSSPVTQPTSTASQTPGIFQFGQQSTEPPGGGFSLGTGGGRDDKSSRRILKVKRKK